MYLVWWFQSLDAITNKALEIFLVFLIKQTAGLNYLTVVNAEACSKMK